MRHGMDPLSGIVAELLAERRRLDDLLDDALEQFALFEDGLTARLHGATPEQGAALMAERARMEDVLGVAELVDRIDRIRERIDLIQSDQAAAA